MASEAVITFFLQKLSDLIIQEVNLLQGVDEEVRLLKSELEWISLFVKDADEKRRSDPKLALWVRQLREIIFHAEDVIDEFMLKVDQHQRSHGGLIGSLKSCITCTRQLPLLHELGSQIKVINTMAQKISSNQSKYCIEDIRAVRGEFSSGTSSLQHQKITRPPIAEESDVVGFKDDLKNVVKILVEGGQRGDDWRQLSVVSIVGMGGLGKTTLANKVYNSSVVRENFDCFAWISVSQDYRLKDLLQSIIKCFPNLSLKDLETVTAEKLGNKLHEFLLEGDRKYLIVLDDIWKKEDWDVLKFAFPVKSNGSRILITTRNRDIAEYADSSSNNIYKLPLLDKKESWKLFLNKVFRLGGGNNDTQESKCPENLKVLGEHMVRKCRGLPLAIVVLGGLLSSKEATEVAWSRVYKNVQWELSHGAGLHSCSGILAFSYCDLPYYLKPCFMYMSLFPEDYKISASKLFNYWIAEGFVQRRGEENLEDIAEDYLKELIHRSMIQVGKWRYDGRVQSCRIHDLLRDLAIAESKEDHFSHQVFRKVNDFTNYNVRRLSFIGGREDHSLSQICYTRYVRSLICYSIRREDKQFWISVCASFKLLKVLDIVKCEIPITLPTAIGELIHLKYLGVSSRVVIPNSITKLVNLQTLNIELYYNVDEIPSQIWSLRQLRHLEVINGCHHRPLIRCPTIIRSTSCQLRNLTNLQSLVIEFFGCINGVALGRLIMLRKLKISANSVLKVKEIVDSIAKLTCLRSLKLETEGKFPAMINFSSNSHLTKLYLHGDLSNNNEILFPPNLIKIRLKRSYMERNQIVQVLGKLQNLKFLKLRVNAYIGNKMVLSHGGFPRLQALKLECLSVEELIVEEGALISLTHLTIVACEELKMLPDGLRHLSKLEGLRVTLMPEGFYARLKENEGEDWDKIKHIPSVILSPYPIVLNEHQN